MNNIYKEIKKLGDDIIQAQNLLTEALATLAVSPKEASTYFDQLREKLTEIEIQTKIILPISLNIFKKELTENQKEVCHD